MRQFLKALPKLNLKYLTIFIVGTILVLLWAMPSIAADCKSLAAYQSEYKDCHACLSIKVMLEAFMTAASKTYDISREAGTILLKIGSFLSKREAGEKPTISASYFFAISIIFSLIAFLPP